MSTGISEDEYETAELVVLQEKRTQEMAKSSDGKILFAAAGFVVEVNLKNAILFNRLLNPKSQIPRINKAIWEISQI